METHPPKLIEEIAGMLIPPACREHVLGDWYERYRSRSQYVFDAIATLPLIIASQIRRTFRIELFLAEACALYIAFACVSFWGGPGYLYDRGVLLPLGIVIGLVLFVFTLCDAYTDPQDQSRNTIYRDTALAITFAYFGQGAIGLFSPGRALPAWLILSGTALSFPMLVVVRNWYRTIRNLPSRVPANMPLDDLHRRSVDEHRKAWHVNFAWLAAALLVWFTSWTATPQGLPGILLFLGIICGMLLKKYGGWKEGKVGSRYRWASASISPRLEPHRIQLEGTRDGLQLWSGGGRLWESGGPALSLLVIIGFPFFLLLLTWVLRGPLTTDIDTARWWLRLAGFLALCVSWVYVRRLNDRAARTIQQEIDALDEREKKQ
jgi:hypothetical protein